MVRKPTKTKTALVNDLKNIIDHGQGMINARCQTEKGQIKARRLMMKKIDATLETLWVEVAELLKDAGQWAA